MLLWGGAVFELNFCHRVERLLEFGPKLSATTDQYRQIIAGHDRRYYQRPSGCLQYLKHNTKDIGDGDKGDV